MFYVWYSESPLTQKIYVCYEQGFETFQVYDVLKFYLCMSSTFLLIFISFVFVLSCTSFSHMRVLFLAITEDSKI